MEVILKRQGTSLIPAHVSDFDKVSKLKEGDNYMFTLKRVRNLEFHRKYFALINLAFSNQEQINDVTSFRYYVQMKAGYFEAIQTDKGMMYLPKSIAFDKMGDDEFADLYSKVLDVIIKLLGLSAEDIENEIYSFF